MKSFNLEIPKQNEQKKNHSGYIQIRVNGCLKLEHRYIVEVFTGKELTEEEVIHHIDGNRQNNDISNLCPFPNEEAHKLFHRKLNKVGYTKELQDEIKKLRKRYGLP